MGERRRWSEMDKSAIPLAKLRKAFETYNQTPGKPPSTYRWYSDKLSLFERYLGDGCQLADLTVESAREFIAHLQGRTVRHEHNPFVTNKEGPLSSSYIQGFARALRAFSTWLHAEGYTDTNVLKPLKPPRIQRKVVQVLTEEEIGRVLARFDQDDPFGFRNYAIVWTMRDCGLRAAELCNLRTEDAHIEEGYLKVLGKGNKERLVPVGGRTQTIVDAIPVEVAKRQRLAQVAASVSAEDGNVLIFQSKIDNLGRGSKDVPCHGQGPQRQQRDDRRL